VRPGSRLRIGALLIAGTLSVHELRFVLAPGGGADGLERHGYLSLAVPAAAAVVALALGGMVLRLAGRPTRDRGADQVALWRLALAAAAVLLVLFVGQETIESALGGQGPSGVGVIDGAGGWVAIPLSVLLGGCVALAARAGRRPLVPVRVAGGLAVAPRAESPVRRPVDPFLPCLTALARHLAGRGPPSPSVS